jgi:hypothetical protein
MYSPECVREIILQLVGLCSCFRAVVFVVGVSVVLLSVRSAGVPLARLLSALWINQ